MIILINGPLGIGKTELSWKLLEYFERGVMLDGDYLGAVHPFEIYDQERIDYLYRTIQHMIAFHVEQGRYRNFVMNYVFEQPGELARLRHLLAGLDDEIYAFRLVCAEEEMERRIRRRDSLLPPDPQRVSWELNRFRELLAIQNEAARRGDLGFVIDTTHLSVEGAAQAIWCNIREEVALVPYDPAWPRQFEVEEGLIRAALGDLALEIAHIGSTAVPGLSAKPVIDILVTVRRLEDAVDCIAPLQKLGYAFIDYPQNTERRFFRKGLPRTHHLHIVAQDHYEHRAHLDFRDALRSDAQLCADYQALKSRLAACYRSDRARYSEMKTAFISEALAQRRP